MCIIRVGGGDSVAKLKNKMQEMFCRHYITEIDGEAFNGYKAAVKAGYKEHSARFQASRLLTKDNIRERVAELQKEAFKRCEMDADYVLSKFKKIIDDDIRNYLSFGMKAILVGYKTDDDGEKTPVYEDQVAVDIKDSSDVDTWNVSEISIGRDGQFKFKLHDKKGALQDVGKHLKLFTDKVEHSGEIKMPVIKITK